jgi:hypothetical protein
MMRLCQLTVIWRGTVHDGFLALWQVMALRDMTILWACHPPRGAARPELRPRLPRGGIL